MEESFMNHPRFTHSNCQRVLIKTERQRMCCLYEELSDVLQSDLACETRAQSEVKSDWHEYDQMDMWG